jgi:hypothetical protein
MTHDRTDDVLKDLEAALAVTPSPEFAEGVRARIHGESAPRRIWPVWAMAGLAAAAVFAIVFPTRQPSRPELQQPAAETPHVAEAARPTSSSVAPAEPAAPRATPQREQHRIVSSPVPAEPVLEVISSQGEMLRRMWARVTPNGALKEVDAPTVEQPLGGNAAIVSDAVTAPVAIVPVVVKPLGEGGDRPDQPIVRNREINAGRDR